jgi:cytochrome oxidase Cu insertion factor (SCO1/SenC/PrrC family)
MSLSGPQKEATMRSSPPGQTNRRAIAGWLGVSIIVALTPVISRAAESSALRIKIGEKAPNFDLAAPDGRRVKLSDFTGHKVLIDFYRGYW